MKIGDVLIYKTEKPDPFYQQFSGDKVMLIQEEFADGGLDVYRWMVRHCKTGLSFLAEVSELKEKQL